MTGEWQPIETAPKVTEVLIWDGMNYWLAVAPDSGVGDDWWVDEDLSIRPTHWMPLPAPPKEQA